MTILFLRIHLWPVIKNSRLLRTLGVTGIFCFIAALVFFSIFFSYRSKADAIEKKIEKNLQTLLSLQSAAKMEEGAVPESGKERWSKKTFAAFEEVIPFIADLENLFSAIDPESSITIKSPEGQILLDHFADYSIRLNLNQDPALLFRAMEELDRSRFIIKTMAFNLYYKPSDKNEGINDLREAYMVIRLYIK